MVLVYIFINAKCIRSLKLECQSINGMFTYVSRMLWSTLLLGQYILSRRYCSAK